MSYLACTENFDLFGGFLPCPPSETGVPAGPLSPTLGVFIFSWGGREH